ncbi:MAG TPA: cytochrome c [Burkholderiales bacterium]
MSTPRLAVLAAAAWFSFAACAETPHLGRALSAAELAAWDISILPDGNGLPPGSGTAAQGAAVYAQKCAFCHGDKAEGRPPYTRLIGGAPITSISAAEKTIANFYPYATTLFDFIRRAMPWQQPRTLSNDEVYALVAFVLAGNKLIGEGEAMNAQSLPKVRMPNREGFIPRFPEKM